jgi:hypothetical protein
MKTKTKAIAKEKIKTKDPISLIDSARRCVSLKEQTEFAKTLQKKEAQYLIDNVIIRKMQQDQAAKDIKNIVSVLFQYALLKQKKLVGDKEGHHLTVIAQSGFKVNPLLVYKWMSDHFKPKKVERLFNLVFSVNILEAKKIIAEEDLKDECEGVLTTKEYGYPKIV